MPRPFDGPPEQREVELPGGGGSMPVIFVLRDGEPHWYFPIRPICKRVKVLAQPQTDKLRASRLYRSHVDNFPIKWPKGGTQPTWCIDDDALPLWIGSFDDSRLSDEVAESLIPFQRLLMAEAKRLFLGGNGGIVPLTPARVVALESDVRAVEGFVLRLEERVGHLESDTNESDAKDDDTNEG